MAIQKLGHVGLYVQDMLAMKHFYTDVLGLQITDEDPNDRAIFMSSDPDHEHHELALFQNPSDQKSYVQQISFSCENLQDIVDYYHRFKEHGVRFDRVLSHGIAVGLYFFDPEGNRCEVYWTTPFQARQPYAVGIDVTRPIDDILREIQEDVKVYGATGHIDPASLQQQREQFAADGVRV